MRRPRAALVSSSSCNVSDESQNNAYALGEPSIILIFTLISYKRFSHTGCKVRFIEHMLGLSMCRNDILLVCFSSDNSECSTICILNP